MVKVNVAGHEYYLDGYLKTNLDNIKKIIRKSWDFVFVVDGYEGAGKSVFCQQLAHYVSDGDFNVDEVVFDPKDFKEQVLKSKKYNAIVFDEAFRGMSARAAMSQINKTLMGMLQEIRQRNLFIFIVLPSIHDLDKYVALHRTAGLFHISVGENRERGYFNYYNKEQIVNLLKDYKNKYKYPRYPKIRGRFTKWQPFAEAYEKKKMDSLRDYVDEKPKAYNDRHKESIVGAILNLKKRGLTNKEIAVIFNKEQTYIRDMLKGSNLEGWNEGKGTNNLDFGGKFNNTNR